MKHMNTAVSSLLIPAAIALMAMSPATSQASANSVLDRVREGYFMIAGFPSTVTSNGPPQDGLISLMEFFSSSAQTIAAANGVTTCQVVPASGTASGTVTVPTALTAFLGSTGVATITYETPLVNAPTGWTGAGAKFAKRVKLTKSGGIAFVMEFNCSTNEYFTSLSIPGDNISTSTRDINLYIKKSGAALTADFFMTVTLASRATLVDSQAIRLETSDGVTFKVWNVGVVMRDNSYTCDGSPCSDQYGFEKSLIQGNSTTKIASVYAKLEKPNFGGAGNPTAKANFITDSTATGSATGSFDFATSEPNQGVSVERTGCMNFTTRVNPANGAFCTGAGSTLAAPLTAPIADASGAFTVDWVKTTLKSKMVFAN
ncbi:hypothetical protein BH10BDE1_BH10BDE1_05020 [soil metagenome]